MRKITEKTKIREKRGTGTGSKYKPWIKAREVASEGTASTFTDYKHGREIQVLSQGELYYYYILRWNDDVEDIREQYPLDLKITLEIAKQLGIKHPKDNNTHMTTDFLITKKDGTYEAYSIKSGRKELSNIRTKEKMLIEKEYWKRLNIQFKVMYKSDINVLFVQNIMDVVKCYYLSDVHTKEDEIRYKIANKELKVRMDRKYLNYKEFYPLLEGGNDDE